MEFVCKDGMYLAEWDKCMNTGTQDMYMSQVEDGTGNWYY